MSPIPARILFIAAAAAALLVPATLHAYVPEWARHADIAETHVGKLQSGDFNGDGKQDLVVRTYMNGGGAVRLRLATPGFTFAAPQVLISSSTLTSSAVVDVTSDGRVDVLAADAFALSVLPSNGDGTFGAAIVTNLPAAAWQIVTGDFNGDHQIDVALHTAGNVLQATSNIETAMFAPYTDDPLVPGTVVKAAHVKELIDATNWYRGAIGLSPISIPNAAAGNIIRAADLTTIRNAINEGRAAFDASAAPLNTTVAAGATIRAQDLQDLRDALR